MKKLIILNAFLLMSLLLQFCYKTDTVAETDLTNQVNPTENVTDRTDCGCNLQVIANMGGSSSTVPWLFELSYIGSDGNTHIKQVTANGTSNNALTIKEGTTQTWSFYGGGNGSSVVNVSARLSCGGNGCKICGPIHSYTVPANTPAWPTGGVYVTNSSTNASCTVQ